MPLEKCPACGSEAKLFSGGAHSWVSCSDWSGCRVIGPLDDPGGSKWNAMCRAIQRKEVTEVSIPCTPDNTRVGAVVRLNSGGPEMTVIDVSEFDGATALCIATEYQLKIKTVPLACLTIVRPAPEQKGGE